MRLSSIFYAIAVPLLCRLARVSAQFATQVMLQEKLSGLGEITDIQNAGDDRLFVVARNGTIRVIQIDPTTGNVMGSPKVFLNVPNVYSTGQEQGLLGLTFHPNYKTNGHFFVNYISSLYPSPSKTVISRFTVTGDPDVANATSERVIAEIVQPYANHNAGQLIFWGGYLYIATGDGGSGDDPGENGQNTTSILGKMLRVDVDNLTSSTLPRWTIPSTNPFVGKAGYLPEIWAYGLRNPWRFSFDRLTGDMWIADVGQNQREEVDFEVANSGGQNYGWGCCEGLRRNTDYKGAGCGDCSAGNSNDYSVPAFEYNRSMGSSITGGYVYRGIAYASLNGTYFYADFGSGRLWGARPNGLGGFIPDFISMGERFVSSPTTFGEDKNGELYVGTLGGVLHRITAIEQTPAPTPAPIIAPMPITSMPPTTMPSIQPTYDYIDCPFMYDKSIALSPGLNMSYALRTPQDSAALTAYGGVLCVQLVSDKIGWIGFASTLNGSMPGSQAVIGRLDPNVPADAPNPGKWYLKERSAPTIMELMPRQTLINATIVTNIFSQTTKLTFAKLLIEQGEITINATGNNKFLWARGSGDTSFNYHDERGTVSLTFCLTDDDCGGGTMCNPRICTSSFTCQEGPSPCAANETCVLNTACVPCSSCSNNEASCESAAPKCSFDVPACASDGTCNGCNQRRKCINLVGCTWKKRRWKDGRWRKGRCRGLLSTSGKICSGTNPGYSCAPNSTPSPTPSPTPIQSQTLNSNRNQTA